MINNMIASIQGKIILKKDKFIIVDVDKIGYKVNVSPDTLTRLNNKEELVFFWIHSHIREDAQDLYGFLNYEELEFFEMLINVSGIGPRGALTILSVASIDILKKAISSEDTSYLTKISGIGRKTAEKIVIELRDKFEIEKTDENLQGEIDALEALKSLGYSQKEARDALKEVSGETDINKKIKEALKILGGK